LSCYLLSTLDTHGRTLWADILERLRRINGLLEASGLARREADQQITEEMAHTRQQLDRLDA
jgi:hypothetical protein